LLILQLAKIYFFENTSGLSGHDRGKTAPQIADVRGYSRRMVQNWIIKKIAMALMGLMRIQAMQHAQTQITSR
jgi:hypothetical protein